MLFAGTFTGFIRYVVANPLLRSPDSVDPGSVVTSSSLAFLPGSALLLIFGISTGELFEYALLASLAPLIGRHEGLRQAAFAARRENLALLLDLIWFLLFLAGLLLTETASGVEVALVWAGSGAAAALVVARKNLTGRLLVSLQFTRTLGPLCAEFAILRGAPLIAMTSVAGLTLPSEFGAWSGVLNLLGPVAILTSGMVGIGLTRLSALAKSDRAAAAQAGVIISLALMSVSAIAGAVVWILLQSDLLGVGASASTMQMFVAPAAIFAAIGGGVQGLRVTFQALEGPQRTAIKVQGISSGAIAIGMVSLAPFGALFSAWAAVLAGTIGIALWALHIFQVTSSDPLGGI